MQEELGIAAADSLEESVSILRGLGDRLAEGQWVHVANIAGQIEVVCRDGSYGMSVADPFEETRGLRGLTANGRSALPDSFDSCGCGAVLEDNSQLGEALVELEKSRQEGLLGCNAVGDDARDFAMDVENHVVLLHGFKGGVEVVEGGDSCV